MTDVLWTNLFKDFIKQFLSDGTTFPLDNVTLRLLKILIIQQIASNNHISHDPPFFLQHNLGAYQNFRGFLYTFSSGRMNISVLRICSLLLLVTCPVWLHSPTELPPLKWGVPGGYLPLNLEGGRRCKIGYKFIFRRCRKIFWFWTCASAAVHNKNTFFNDRWFYCWPFLCVIFMLVEQAVRKSFVVEMTARSAQWIQNVCNGRTSWTTSFVSSVISSSKKIKLHWHFNWKERSVTIDRSRFETFKFAAKER